MDYPVRAIFAVFRVMICFYFLFGVLAPIFLPKVKRDFSVERIIYSWIGLGGLILINVMILTILNLYDFISLFFTLILLPVIYFVIKEKRKGKKVWDILLAGEDKIVSAQVKAIEKTLLTFNDIKNILRERKFSIKENIKTLLAFSIALSAAFVRIIPALSNSAPFTRAWYFELSSVKLLNLQHYFDATPVPKGMHSIVNIFSTLTQVTPELILHILGALTSFFLALIIFWVIEVITKTKYNPAAYFGAAFYALTPVFFLPLSLDLEVEASSLSLALCFAIPTGVFFFRNMRSEMKIKWFYITTGVFATALTNLFVFLVVLLPLFFFGLFIIPRKMFIKRFSKAVVFLIGSYSIALLPYVIVCLLNDISPIVFFREQLFDTLVFSFFPNLITPLDQLSLYYFYIALGIFCIKIGLSFWTKKEQSRIEILFLFIFLTIAFVYTPYFIYSYVLVDPDQLNLFYAILISIFVGIVFNNIGSLTSIILKEHKRIQNLVLPILATMGIISLLFIQGDNLLKRDLPQTLPNGFFNAYYTIVGERIPYTYATVGPNIDKELAQNRHYFMNYEFFLDNYGSIDSLYQQYLLVPKQEQNFKEIPPASIFLFLEKPPYGYIQQGILYNADAVMNDMQQWISSFRNLEGRKIDVYYESEEAIVYEIVNQENESRIGNVLMNIWAREEEDGIVKFD